VSLEDRVEVDRPLRRLRRGTSRRDIELEIEGVEHTHKVSEFGVRLTGLELVHPLPAHARSLCELVLAESQLQPTTADMRGCLADGSQKHVFTSPLLPMGSIVPMIPLGVNRILRPIGGSAANAAPRGFIRRLGNGFATILGA
jgi:hypothetical protein